MRTRLMLLLGVLALALALAPGAQALPGLTLGFDGDLGLTSGDSASANVWIPDAVHEGVGVVRFNVMWDQVAPRVRPHRFAAGDPASPGYDWTQVDQVVRQLHAAGLTVLMNLSVAPTWAEGSHRPRSAAPGTWRPSPPAFAAFATAAAKRYDGGYPDPLEPGRSLPRIRDWQGWNEPNLNNWLNPQWVRAGHGWKPESPTIYRALDNAFYKAVKGVSRSNFVVMAGTAPYGDAPGQGRMPPAQFDRSLFCVNGTRHLTPAPCSDPLHVDAIDHHPYGIGGPLWHAYNADDVAVPDLPKITGPLHAAERWHRILPAGPKRLWVTELSWDSNPPDPNGVPVQTQARWYEQSMYVLWREGVDTILFYAIVDAPPIPNYSSTYQAGIYYLDGEPKPSATAFRFPFVTQRSDARHLQAWGRSPISGTLTIEQRRGSHWTVLKRISGKAGRVFQVGLSIRGAATLRAEVGSLTSLTWHQK
jgi:hypothetical protein